MVLNPVISKLGGKLVVLASASPRRREILTNVGLRFEVVPSWFKETLEKSLFKAPYEYAVETAKQKALEVARRMPFKHLKTPDIVIGADTVVTVDGYILEKPVDKEDAYRMLSRLSGKEHSVFTGVAIVHCNSELGKEVEYDVVDFYEETKVKFADLSEDMLWEYIHSGEPMDKAGGYGIQALGGMLVEYVHGDFLNVVGFPLNHFCKKLGEMYNPPSKNEVKHIRYDSIPYVETFDSPIYMENGWPRWAENRAEAKDSRDGEGHSHHWVSPGAGAAELQPRASVISKFPKRIADLMDGFKASKTLFTASKLKVFDLLVSPGGLTVAEMAVQIPASVIGTERLLDSVVSLGLLEKSHLGESIVYKNTEEANQYLVSSSNCSLHGYIIYCNDRIWPLFTHLEDAVQEGTNQFERAFGKKSSELSRDSCLSDKEMKLQFMNAMHSIATVTGADIAAAFDLSPFKTACDLGGCTGAMACQFTKLYPSLSVTIFDLPAVVEMRSHFCTQSEDLSRVTFAAGDFFKDDLPKADLYILARILHDLTDDKINILLSRLSQMCSPGCGLLVAEIFLDEEQRTPSRALLQALSMSDGRQRSASQYSQILKKYGFNEICVKHTGNFLDAILCVKQ
ncbi:putative bifunctional dTTP/UTP pyrophosphatase/methyltransferase protein isoform X1 [Amia ocellicauda]|uniref:putative bifunctional dTTP/UTP pyrophosphatase/methyltransferase protein isoform X1 n=1 Tax=Amia ocellicauda TaxID=2972642 RepID=UPI003463D9EF